MFTAQGFWFNSHAPNAIKLTETNNIMSDNKITEWKEAKRNREHAEAWQDLPNGKKYQNDTMEISLDHCKPPRLMRAGQKTQGGQNYWETNQEFSLAILQHVVEQWCDIGPKVIQIMKDNENSKLNECQEFVDAMQSEIRKNQTKR